MDDGIFGNVFEDFFRDLVVFPDKVLWAKLGPWFAMNEWISEFYPCNQSICQIDFVKFEWCDNSSFAKLINCYPLLQRFEILSFWMIKLTCSNQSFILKNHLLKFLLWKRFQSTIGAFSIHAKSAMCICDNFLVWSV